jgi:hypothetical protein
MPASERRHVERETVLPARERRRRRPSGSGIGIDADGYPVIDPTENVRELFEAGATRQDDLRLAERRLQEEKIARVEGDMRALQREVALRAEHQKDLDTLEAKRLDAVRSVDQLAVKTEADRSAAAITALANAAATTAETLRSAVNTSATNLATQLDRTVTAITERIAALEKSSYTGAGKQAVADPMMEQLIGEMRNLTAQRAADLGKAAVVDPRLAELMADVRSNTARLQAGAGKSEGMSDLWKLIIAAVGLLVALNALGLFARPSAPVYTPAPYGTQLPTTPPAPVPR